MSAPKPIGFEVVIEVASSGKRSLTTRRWRQPFIGRARAMAMRVAGAVCIVSVKPLHAADFAA